MSSSPLLAALPDYLVAAVEVIGGNASWPLSSIALVIEAYRDAGMINRGGDLQIIRDGCAWESPNIGVWIFNGELTGPENGLVNEAADLALAKLAALDREALREDVVAGCPFLTETALAIDLSILRMTWRAELSLPRDDVASAG
ncbi:hypothetical protein [Caulobacter sp.]|uniref:hypothetical protein n=1 Tax=Caulobacter sp. TaxID=78 RepID=UPI001AFD7AE6|nr:hypothetical protein [Caulobacter sp.]MBO9547253.1 hypothetical protein [Caulobacter sp.]